MYSHRNIYGSPPSEFSNNSFIDHSSNTPARPDVTFPQYAPWFPDQPASATGYDSRHNSVGYDGGYGGGYQHHVPSQPRQDSWGAGSAFMRQLPQQQQQQQGSPAQTPMQMSGFQLESFAQQPAGQVHSAYGMQQHPQYTGYQTSSQYDQSQYPGFPPQQQQQQYHPYAQHQHHHQPQSMLYGASQPVAVHLLYGASQPVAVHYRSLHPREYMQQHTAAPEAWDGYSWKQMHDLFDALKDAWSARKSDVEARGRALPFGGNNIYGGGQSQECARLAQLAKEATTNVASVDASARKVQEVYGGYHQPGDLAWGWHVREAINAALALPDWPQ